LFSLAHVPGNPITILGPWAVVGLVMRAQLTSRLAGIRARFLLETALMWREDRLAFGLALMTLLLVLTYLLDLVTQPLTGFDAMSMWFFKAGLFYNTRSVDLASIPNLGLTWPGASPTAFPITAGLIRSLDYPPLYSLEVASVYALAGGVHDTLGKGLEMVFVVTSVTTTLALLGPRLGRRTILMFVVLVLAISPVQSALGDPLYTGYADYPVAILLLAVIANLYIAEESRRTDAYVLALGLALVAALLKSEGQVAFVLVGFVVAERALLAGGGAHQPRPRFTQMAPVALLLVLLIGWQVSAAAHGWRSHHLLNDDVGTLAGAIPARAILIAAYGVLRLGQVPNYIPIAGAYAVSSLLILRAGGPARTCWLVLTLYGLSFYAIFVLNPGELVGTFDRAVIEIAPSVAILLGLALTRHPAASMSDDSGAGGDHPARQLDGTIPVDRPYPVGLGDHGAGVTAARGTGRRDGA